MKNYKEMANAVFRRIEKYEIEQMKRRSTMKKVITPICCFCLVALMGIGFWQGGLFNTDKPAQIDDSTIVGDKDYVSLEENSQTTVGRIKVLGVNYVQSCAADKVYTPDKELGKVNEFEGTYQEGSFQMPIDEVVSGEVYFAKEDPNVLLVPVKNGEYVDYWIYIKE